MDSSADEVRIVSAQVHDSQPDRAQSDRAQLDHTQSDIVRAAGQLGITTLKRCDTSIVYALSPPISDSDRDRVANELIQDPVVQRLADSSQSEPPDVVVEVWRRPGVTDPEARELEAGLARLGIECQASRIRRHELFGDLGDDSIHRLARTVLANTTVDDYVIGQRPPGRATVQSQPPGVTIVPLRDLSTADLVSVSRELQLALDADEMQVISTFFTAEGRDPTRAELEALAQTWSEHCVHKTFRAEISLTHTERSGEEKTETIDGLLKTCLRAVTDEIWPSWLHSAFVDNAGIIEFDDRFDLAIKVETHNHPSALEPFGGANTGVGGVVRDVIGVSARPIAAVDVLCFGPTDTDPNRLPAGVLHPQRIADGVVAGIGDYGNKLGLPTIGGAVIYDEGYLGNPLVYCGAIGILPTGSHPTDPQVGDLVVAAGGRTGRDGLKGATFSSAELTTEAALGMGSAVQIGDPITEKGVLEFVEEARDARLYNAITDCGAGGFSSAVGEMASDIGAAIDTATAPLKYEGLQPWEILLSEAQERMVLAVPPDHLDQLHEIAERWHVELSVLGRFSGDGRFKVTHGGLDVVDLPMDFLHDGLPKRRMDAVWADPPLPDKNPEELTGTSSTSLRTWLLAALADPDVATKEHIVRTYDHEVRGGSVSRPTCGPFADGPSDAAVLRPLRTWDRPRGFAVGFGINPYLGRIDPYAMALGVIDEAIRNIVAVGADPSRIALVDNFCWGNPTIEDRLGSLARAAQGCEVGARAYRAPFISGKDSLFNEFEGNPVPPTLLITALGLVPDIEQVASSHFKGPGHDLWLVGDTQPHLASSLLSRLLGQPCAGLPQLDLDSMDPIERYRKVHDTIVSGEALAVHDLSEGGLAVGVAEMCVGGRTGAIVNADANAFGLDSFDHDTFTMAFSETPGRFLIEADPASRTIIEDRFGPEASRIGQTTHLAELDLFGERIDLAEMIQAFKGSLAS